MVAIDGRLAALLELRKESTARRRNASIAFLRAPALLYPDPRMEVAVADLSRQATFDLLVCDFTFTGLLKFRHIFDAVACLLAHPARMIVFHLNPSGEPAHLNSPDVIQHAVVPVGHSTIMFTGSTVARAAFVVLEWATKLRRRYRRLGARPCTAAWPLAP